MAGNPFENFLPQWFFSCSLELRREDERGKERNGRNDRRRKRVTLEEERRKSVRIKLKK